LGALIDYHMHRILNLPLVVETTTLTWTF
jgi:hypothetical protein